MIRHNAARSPSITSQSSYSAVIITDLVAEVPVISEHEKEDHSKQSVEVTNFAYDGHLDAEDASNGSKPRSNSMGISRGVILNAVQFGQNEPKSKLDEKSVQLTSTLPVPTVSEQTVESKGFKDMSLSRKIAFVASFLPSIFFVLCFAVILPCNVPKPCIEEIWMQTFNDTEATSRLEIPGDVVFTVLKQGVLKQGAIFELNKESGKLNEIKLGDDNKAVDLKCGKIMNKDKTDCIIMDNMGKIHSFDNSNSNVIWTPLSVGDERTSKLAILNGCKDDLNDVALAVSRTKFRVLHDGSRKHSFPVSDCDSFPFGLTPWELDGFSNLLFSCEKNGSDVLMNIPKNIWCFYSYNKTEEPNKLATRPLNSLKNSVLKPLKDRLVLWSGNEVTMILPNATELWKLSNLSQPEENRFIFAGNFYGENKQIGLFSSSLSTGLMVTLLDPTDGSFVKSISHSNCEATDMIHVKGKKRDFILMLLKKTVDDIVTTALAQINDISTTIVSLVSEEEINNAIKPPVSEELAFLDLEGTEGSIDTIKVIRDLKNENYRSSIADFSDTKTDVLSIYVLSTSDDLKMNTTEVRRIDVANWDKSIKSKCKIS